jgi:formate-dependent nitrite reductase membrane component NrfD
MSTSDWTAILSVAVALLAIVIPLLLRRSDQQRVQIEKLTTENQRLRDANVDLKIANASLARVGNVLDRTFAALPAPDTHEGSTT